MRGLISTAAPGAAEATARTFRTRQVGDGAGAVRTFGTVVEAGAGPIRFRGRDAAACAHPAPPPSCARGKVAAFSRHGALCNAVCYQTSDCRTSARVVGCCNATAAVAALYAEASRGGRVRMRVALPGRRRALVDASVRREGPASGARVAQTWRGIPFTVHGDARLEGRRCVACAGPLNSYLIIEARRGEEAARFPVEEAARLWRRCGIGRERLLARVAVIEPSAAPMPRVKFFTCGDREHPSAPLTGLAVLALAARRLDWGRLRVAGRVATPSGPMALPRVRALADGSFDVAFPEMIVDLGPTMRPPAPARA